MGVLLLTERIEIEKYLDQIRQAADTEKDAFGFLPRSAYAEFIYQNRIVVAVDARSRSLLGYILYGGAIPQGRIFQTWTLPDSRGEGIGRRLVQEVISRLEALSYLSIKADVADDLEQANQFYGRLGFEIANQRPGKTVGRLINVRVRELSTPSLLEMAIAPGEVGTCLPIDIPAGRKTPLYVMDLNVLFDVVKQRPRAAAGHKIMAAAFENDIRLAVSAEMASELERHTIDGSPDPTLELARSLPRLPVPTGRRLTALIRDLAPRIFPDRARESRLKVQDFSDLNHLATAIDECAAGFITSEKSILQASQELLEKHGLEILSPDSFSPSFELGSESASSLSVYSGESRVIASQFKSESYTELEDFLARFHVPSREVRQYLAAGTATSPRRRFVVRIDSRVIGFASWDAPTGPSSRDLKIIIDEGSNAASIAAEYLVGKAKSDVGPISPSLYRIVPTVRQPTVRRVAIANGFFPEEGAPPRAQTLRKVAVGHVVTPWNWLSLRKKMQEQAGLSLPAKLPSFSGLSEPLSMLDSKGRSVAVTLAEFERLMSPLISALPARPAAILPITQMYAEELFRGSAQRSFLSDREAVLRTVRGYASKSSTYTTVADGGLVVFYESSTGGGRSAATAVARVKRRYLMIKEDAERFLSERGVIDPNHVGGMSRGRQVAVIEFEDLMIFETPVRLKRLRAIGCADGSNYVTARRLNYEHLLEILAEGKPRAG